MADGSIERWRPDDTRPEILDERLAWAPRGGAVVSLDVREYFATVWEDE